MGSTQKKKLQYKYRLSRLSRLTHGANWLTRLLIIHQLRVMAFHHSSNIWPKMISFVPSRRIGAVTIVALLYIIIVIRNSSLCPQNSPTRKAWSLYSVVLWPLGAWICIQLSRSQRGIDSFGRKRHGCELGMAVGGPSDGVKSQILSSGRQSIRWWAGPGTAKARRTAVSPTKSPGKGAAHRGIRRPSEVGPLIITCTFERDSLTSAWYTKY